MRGQRVSHVFGCVRTTGVTSGVPCLGELRTCVACIACLACGACVRTDTRVFKNKHTRVFKKKQPLSPLCPRIISVLCCHAVSVSL